MSSIRMLSLNIEGKRHLERVQAFLQRELFDVIVLQEVFEEDIHSIEKVVGSDSLFMTAMTKLEGKPWGNLVLCHIPKHRYISKYYVGSKEEIHEHIKERPFDQCKSYVGVEFEHEGSFYRLLGTHFTWSPKGEPSDLQREELTKLFSVLDELDHFVIAGDFNTPRGTEIFDTIAKKYKDNIPPEVTTTIDGNFHKAGHLQYVVDGMFSTPEYAVHNVKVVDGLSDHCGIIAEIEKLG